LKTTRALHFFLVSVTVGETSGKDLKVCNQFEKVEWGLQDPLHDFVGTCPPEACKHAVHMEDFRCLAKCVNSVSDCMVTDPHASLIHRNGQTNRTVCRACPLDFCRHCSQDGQRCKGCYEGFNLNNGKCENGWEKTINLCTNVVLAIIGILLAVSVLAFLSFAVWNKCRHKGDDGRLRASLIGLAEGSGRALKDVNASIIKRAIHIARQSNSALSLFALCRQDKRVGELGPGFVLFHHTQIFLIMVSFIAFAAALWAKKYSEIEAIYTWIGNEHYSKCDENITHHMDEIRDNYASVMSWTCLILWIVLILASWVFSWWCVQKVQKYFDKIQLTNVDYTLHITGLPECVTSERFLKDELTKKFNVEIVGVSIGYRIPTRDQKNKIQEMISRIVMDGDIQNGHYYLPETDQETLTENLQKDEKCLKEMLEKDLRGSGEAWVTCSKTQDLQLVAQTRCGFDLNLKDFLKDNGAEVPKIVSISASIHEPQGINFFNLGTPSRIIVYNVACLTMQAIIMFLVFCLCSYWFYDVLLKRYIDADSNPDEDDWALQIVGGLIGICNAVIQIVVQGNAEEVGFSSIDALDTTIFVFNVTVVALNTFTQVFFFAWRGEFARNIKDSSMHSLRLEIETMRNVNAMLVPNQFFVQYVLNELLCTIPVALVSAICMWLFYVWEIKFGVRKLIASLGISLDSDMLNAREAEVAICFPPFMLSLEYTFLIVFPMIAFVALFFVTDRADWIFFGLFVFAVFFYLYQQFINVHFVQKTMHDSAMCFRACMVCWGLVLNMPAAAFVWWRWRAGSLPDVVGLPCAFCFYAVGFLLYMVVLDKLNVFGHGLSIESHTEGDKKFIDHMNDSMPYTWWNTNPIYVLKCHHCPNHPGHECIQDELVGVKCIWPEHFTVPGFVEPGKAFRHKNLKEETRDSPFVVW